MPCWGQEIRNALMNWVVHVAPTTMEAAFEDLFLIFRIHAESQITFAYRAAENIHE